MTANVTDVFNSSNISIAVKFIPDAAIGNSFTLFATGDNQYFINSYSTGFRVYLGFQNLGTIVSANINSYWNVGKENVLIIRGTSGSAKTWLNGILLQTSGAAWSPVNSTNILIG